MYPFTISIILNFLSSNKVSHFTKVERWCYITQFICKNRNWIGGLQFQCVLTIYNLYFIGFYWIFVSKQSNKIIKSSLIYSVRCLSSELTFAGHRCDVSIFTWNTQNCLCVINLNLKWCATALSILHMHILDFLCSSLQLEVWNQSHHSLSLDFYRLL